KGFSPVKPHILTSPGDSHWFLAFIENQTLVVVFDLDYNAAKKICKITIHTGQAGWDSIQSGPGYENRIAKYWEQYDAQMIDHNPPSMPPPPLTPSSPIEWSELILCPFCDARYNYPQSLVDEGRTVECPNCGKYFDL
ncbi:MAG: hypothetical protein ACW96N_05135, partial [Candidatus Thorarchaeota archaeon]